MTNYFYGNKEFDIHQFEWFLPSPLDQFFL